MTDQPVLIALPESLKAKFKALLPDLRELDVHSGEITRETIAKYRKSAPSALVALTRLSDIEVFEAAVGVTAHFICLLTARPSGEGAARLSASASGLMMAAALARHLPDWDLGVEGAQDLDIRDFTNPEDNRHSDSVRLLSWTHRVIIDDPTDDEGVLSGLYYSFTPDVGEDHIEDYKSIVREALL